MFRRILSANDGSGPAFKALALALDLAKQNNSELHMASVEEVVSFPELIGEVENERHAADRRYRNVLKRAKAMAAEKDVRLETHVLVGHPVRSIVDLASELGADLLVIGATGHSALYERMLGSRADRVIQLASCPVLVVK
ncbi:MAG TPA: universal stress protein [Bradyrhizobium sp.]|jgi:nucleotide-binding universal stress UspA family protein